MWKFSKKISLYAGMLAGFVVTIQAFQGTFKTFWPGKQVRISKSSRIFLAQVVPLQQDLFACVTCQGLVLSTQFHEQMLSLLQLSRSWIRSENMQGSDIERFGQLVYDFKKINVQIKAVAPDLIKIPTALIQSIAQILGREVKQVHIGTAAVDLQHIGKFLQQLQEGTWEPTSKTKALQIFSIVQEIMHHFDGVSVTEYDFMILSQCVLFMQLLSCLG